MSTNFCDLFPDPVMQEACTARFDSENQERRRVILTILELLTGLGMYLILVGYTMYEVGIIRAKNSKSVLFKVILVIALTPLVWAFWGIPLSGSSNVNTEQQSEVSLDFWEAPEEFLQAVVLASVCGCFVSGAVAERMSFAAYSIIQLMTIGVIYPLVIRLTLSTEDEGVLWHLGFRDYAGGATVHVCSGTVALVSAWLLGPRTHRFSKSKNGNLVINALPSNSPIFSSLGVLFLLIGWLARLGSFGDTELQSSAAVANALLCVASAVFSAVVYHYAKHKVFSSEVMNTALLGGFVVITPCAGFIHVWASVVLGLLSFLVTSTEPFCYVMFLLQIDDPCEMIRINVFNGFVGAVVGVGLFADANLFPSSHADSPANNFFSKIDEDISKNGWFYGDADNNQFGIQLLGSLVIFVFSAAITYITCICIIKYFGTMRVSLQDETLGLDIRYYNGYAIPELSEFHLRLDNEMKKAQQKLKRIGVKKKPLEITSGGIQRRTTGYGLGSMNTNEDMSIHNDNRTITTTTTATNDDKSVSSVELANVDDSHDVSDDIEANVNNNYDTAGGVVDDNEHIEEMVAAHVALVPSHLRGAQKWANRLSLTTHRPPSGPKSNTSNNSMTFRRSLVKKMLNNNHDDSNLDTEDTNNTGCGSDDEEVQVKNLNSNPIHSPP